VRSLYYLEQARNPGEGRNTFTVFTNLQTDDLAWRRGLYLTMAVMLRLRRKTHHMFVGRLALALLAPLL
jgi:hypothetical protein